MADDDPRGTQDFSGGARSLKPEPKDPMGRMKPGAWIKGPEAEIPHDWQPIMVGDNQWQAWPMPPSSYDPEARRKILAQVDAAYQRCLPTEEHPTRRAVSMLVNPLWHKLFPATRYWGDPPVEVMLADQESQLPQDAPRFKFVAEEVTDAHQPLNPSQVEIKMAPRPDQRWNSPPPAQPFNTVANEADQAAVHTAPPSPDYVEPYSKTLAEAPSQAPLQYTSPGSDLSEAGPTEPSPMQFTAPGPLDESMITTPEGEQLIPPPPPPIQTEAENVARILDD